MGKIKYTKGELKKQRDNLSLFSHYLPTLQLKKQQLQLKILEVRRAINEKKTAYETALKEIMKWAGILADQRFSVAPWLAPKKVFYAIDNIAGVDVWVFKDVTFEEKTYDYYSSPFWVDKAIDILQKQMRILIEIEILDKQIAVLAQELRVTTQRVNLFEKVKIPECAENIRRIKIYLGDQMSNAVGISKVAKRKTLQREEAQILV
ncbi:MAG: V-type ATP synthase subunit D [Candidatus Omnitrophica bacterium]|nr:V-type ATP synthase subunit D [Candidatus Omnitrophota bacterium]